MEKNFKELDPLIASLPKDVVETFITKLGFSEVNQGVELIHEGEIGDEFHIIVEGQAEIYKTSEGREKRIAVVGEGYYIGEYHLLKEGGSEEQPV